MIGAAQGPPWLGAAFIAALVVLHLATRGGRSAGRIVILALVAGLFGSCFDSILILAGVYTPVRWVVPQPFATIWLIVLWVNFALIVDVPLGWLQKHLILAGVCGGIFGPAAYLAAQRLEAIRIGDPPALQIILLAVAWALGLAALMAIARVLPAFRRARQPAPCPAQRCQARRLPKQ